MTEFIEYEETRGKRSIRIEKSAATGDWVLSTDDPDAGSFTEGGDNSISVERLLDTAARFLANKEDRTKSFDVEDAHPRTGRNKRWSLQWSTADGEVVSLIWLGDLGNEQSQLRQDDYEFATKEEAEARLASWLNETADPG